MRGIYIVMFVHILAFGVLDAQQLTGIGTDAPERPLEIVEPLEPRLRLRSTNSTPGIEFLRTGFVGARDWRLINHVGILRLQTSTDDFASSDDVLSVSGAGNLGIGVNIPFTRLHIDGGENASLIDDGYLLLGLKSGANLVMDDHRITARNNGSPASLHIQGHGGDTYVGTNGGNVQIGGGPSGGDLGIGTIVPNARMTIRDTEFQLYLENLTDPSNGWRIGASGSSWVAGADQLLFNPGVGSSSSSLRLFNTTDNNGTTAPVMINSSGGQTILLDGNEIDTKAGPLYINHNSANTTVINGSGGSVGVGTTNLSGSLKIHTPPTEYAFIFERNNVKWGLHPYDVANVLGFVRDGVTRAQVVGANGQWVALSDRRLKENIQPLPDVLDKVSMLGLHAYELAMDDSSHEQYGVLAQELEELFPELVQRDDEMQYTVSYAQLSVIALKALQEQADQIDALKAELQGLISELQ